MIINPHKLKALYLRLVNETPKESRWGWKLEDDTLLLNVISSLEQKDTYSGDIIVVKDGEFWTPCIHLDESTVNMLNPYEVIFRMFQEMLIKFNLPYIYVGAVRKDVRLVRQLVEYPRASENANHAIRDEQTYRILFNEVFISENEDDQSDEEGESVYSTRFNILYALKSSPTAKQQADMVENLPIISFTETSLSKGRVTLKTKKGEFFSAPGTVQNAKGLRTIFVDKPNLPARCKTAVLNPSITIPYGDKPLVR